MKWISTKDELPQEGIYVLARHERGTWFDREDQEGCNYVVVSLEKGLSEKDRAELPDGNPRKRLYCASDEHGNNLKPYYWNQFGPDSFFGQDISFWTYFERIKKD